MQVIGASCLKPGCRLLPRTDTESHLLATVVGLSYSADEARLLLVLATEGHPNLAGIDDSRETSA